MRKFFAKYLFKIKLFILFTATQGRGDEGKGGGNKV